MAYPLHRDGSDGTVGVPASPSFPAMEQDVLAYWQHDGTFQASIDQRPAGEFGANEFVFYDGPPFANGLPHYGHLLTGYVKDVVPRFETMRGRRVERRFGWDTHGLPAELEAMSQLGIKTKEEIVELGRQAVGVPTEPALDPAAAHRLEPRHDVLDVPGEQVTVVRQSVGERRSVVEDELVRAVVAGGALVDRRLEGAVLRPVREHVLLHRREARGGGNTGGVAGSVQRVRHQVAPGRVVVRQVLRGRGAGAHRGTTPLAATCAR